MSITTLTTPISAVTARKQLGTLLDRAFYNRETFIVERAGKPRTVLIPIGDFQAIQQRQQRAKQTVAQMQHEAAKAFACVSEQEKQSLISEAIGWANQ